MVKAALDEELLDGRPADGAALVGGSPGAVGLGEKGLDGLRMEDLDNPVVSATGRMRLSLLVVMRVLAVRPGTP